MQQDDIDPNNNGITSFASHIVDTNSGHVVYVNAYGLGTFTSATVLDGFYIRSNNVGGALSAFYSNATLTNVRFTGNEAPDYGGAIQRRGSIAC